MKSALFLVPKNMITAAIGMKWNMRGIVCSPDTDDCSGIVSIGDGYDNIIEGDALAVITGCGDDVTFEIYQKACAQLNIMTKQEIMWPMTSGSDGMINSMGAASIMLEDMDEALKRKVKIYAEVLGHAITGQPCNTDRLFDSRAV